MTPQCVLLLLTLAHSGVALRFVTSPSRPTALYTAPAPYAAPGRTPLSSVIITSAPLTVFNATAATPVHWRRHDASPENVAVDADKPSSQQLLDAFMKEYAASVKHPAKPPAAGDRNNDRDLLRQPSPANRLASLSLDAEADAEAEGGDVATPVDAGENEASWDLVAAEKHNHPYDDREGWVTLEPVPWSSSKVSKWHSQHPNGNKHPSSQSQSWLNSKPSVSYDQPKPHRPTWERPPSYWDNDKPSKPWDNDKPSKPWDDKPSKPWDEDRPKPWASKPHDDSPYKPWHSDRPSKPSTWDERPSKPSWENDRPSKPTSYDDKPYKPSSWENGPSKPSWESDRPVKPSLWDDKPSKPSWESDRPSKPSSWDADRPKPYDRPSKPSWAQGSRPSSDQSHQGSSHRPSSWSSHHADIITDDSSEPWPADGHHRPQPSYDGNKHRPSLNRPGPGEGPGEWVLLSTTKGYSLPSRQRKGQRSLTVAPLTATRSVRLTVLPALNGSTTSHGGMIEVEKTSLTVDEAQEEDRKSRLLAVRPALTDSPNVASVQEAAVAPLVVSDAVVVTDDGNVTAAAIQPVRRMQLNRRNAMLAAVGAGMVPATMALLVPMMMGRKKRSVDGDRFRNRVQLRHM